MKTFVHLKLHLCHTALQHQNKTLDTVAQVKQAKDDTDISQATDMTGHCAFLYSPYVDPSTSSVQYTDMRDFLYLLLGVTLP